MKKQKIILLLYSIVSLFFLSCAKDKAQNDDLAKKIQADYLGGASRQMDTVFVQFMDNHIKKWELKAVHIDEYEKENKLFAQKVNVISFNVKGKAETNMTSDKAEVDNVSNILTAIDHVVVKSENGTLYTNKLIWNMSTNEVYAENKVKIVREGTTIYGYKLKTDSKLSFTELEKVYGSGTIEEGNIEDI